MKFYSRGNDIMENKNQIFSEIDRREATDIVFEKLCFGDIFYSDDINIEDIQTAIDLDERPVFLEGVVSRLQQLGLKCDIDDTDLILAEIKRRYKDQLGFDCPRTVKEWIRGTIPSVINRKNNYDLCFALEMNLEETAEFFMKHYLTIPFNYKDRIDAIFFYCLFNKKTYSVVERMMCESSTYKTYDKNSTTTLQIGRHILEIDNDDEFLQYLAAHCYNKEQQYQMAKKEISFLIEKHSGGNSVKFEDKVMGFNYQKNLKTKPQKINELPRRFTKSLPQRCIFDDIQNGNEETYETLRKTLIISKLYDFYIDRKEMEKSNEQKIRDDLLDFYDEINLTLSKCGFVQLYERHPFDWLILFCATHPYPIEAFYSLNDMRYRDIG